MRKAMCMNFKKKAFFGVLEIDTRDPVHLWIEKAHVDNFVLTFSKRWNLIIRGDRNPTAIYSFVESLNPENILKENKNILILPV